MSNDAALMKVVQEVPTTVDAGSQSAAAPGSAVDAATIVAAESMRQRDGEDAVKATAVVEGAPPAVADAAAAGFATTVEAAASSASAATPTTPAAPSIAAAAAVLPPTPATVVSFLSTSASGKTRTWHAKYYAPSSSSAPARPSFLDLPESYFAPTASELQAAFAGQVKKREGLVDAPMLTKKLRDAEEAKKDKARSDRWPQTRIRIRFTNRSQLEGVFNSTETMAAIYEFVRFSLAEEHRAVPFTLYQTPPKKEYSKSDPLLKGKSLIDLQFTPSSMFYIRFDVDELNLSSTTPPLIPALIGAIAELPLPPTFDPAAAAAAADLAAAGAAAKIVKTNTLGVSGKTPSWMRGGKSGK